MRTNRTRLATRSGAALALGWLLVSADGAPRTSAPIVAQAPPEHCPPTDWRSLTPCPALRGAGAWQASVLDASPRPRIADLPDAIRFDAVAARAPAPSAQIPEPAPAWILGLGLAALARRRRDHSAPGRAASHARATSAGDRPS